MTIKQPNIKDVAKKAHVSIATVSRVINNKDGFSHETLLRVRKAMSELDYQPNRVAQALKSDSMRIVALSVPFVWHPFYAEFCYYVELELKKYGYGTLLSNNQSDPQSELDFLKMAQENKVDGIIGITYNNIDPYLTSNIPFVSIDRFFDTTKYPYVTTITSDNWQGGQIACRELINRGSNKLAFVGEFAQYPNGALNRKKGFISFAKDNDVSYQIFECPEKSLESSQLLNRVLENIYNIDGIFAVNDETAYQLLLKLQNISVKVPDDLQIIGYDGFNIMKNTPSPISSIAQPVDVIAKTAAINLLKLINKENVSDVTIPVSFRPAKTTRPS
ncbi:LacI family transcriptional regulator [Bombilactobacillus bombi]|uniref:LacI family transcriptional regulator n=1 Tax=Bombilactobacillus bombi TaxID=1303590 RepID=A0A3R6ZVW0_9LACO|nr:LacI family DNA-binding transcriptional regulator [Bombilactobacillus bombi]RHW48212.1 LacI family transcriptional regulator [Bombilactobacillus bombi]